MKLRSLIHHFALLLPLLALPASAVPVNINNASFEAQMANIDPPNQAWTDNLEPDWKETGGPNSPNAFMERLGLAGEDGTDTLGMVLGHDVWQDLNTTYQPNTLYTLTVKVGNRSGSTVAGNQSTYGLATVSGTVAASTAVDASTYTTAGNFADAPPVTFDTYSDPCVTGPIRVLLQARGANRSHFDLIRLDAAPSSPGGRPAGSLQAASGVTASTATLNGTVTAAGSANPSVVFYFDTSDKGGNPASWTGSVAVPGTQSGAFSAGISGLTPFTTYYVRARLTNASGAVWAAPCMSFTTLANPPSVANTAATGVTGATATVGATVTSSGGQAPDVTIYYGPADGGTTQGAWAGSVSIPSLTGSATRLLTGLTQGTVHFYRAFAQNSGGSAWAADSSTFTTTGVALPVVENRGADNITGTSVQLNGEVTASGNETPVVTVYWGLTDGGTNPASWDNSRVLGPDGGNFSTLVQGLTPVTTYYYTARAVNSAGTVWAAPSRSFTTVTALPASVIINEIHYDPLDPTKRQEFIEFHNPTAAPIDMSGWVIDDGVSFTFPSGAASIIAAGGYKVVAENLAAYSAGFPAAPPPVGAWAADDVLSNAGERIRLKDAAGNVVDTVTYGVGFPWPASAKGTGPSIELIHPSLNNDLGGSWRSAVPPTFPPATTYIPFASTWRWRKGVQGDTGEPAGQFTAWRNLAFTEPVAPATNAGWQDGVTPIGYGENDGVAGTTENTTLLTDMVSTYASIYMRRTFTIPAGQLPVALRIRGRCDDGFLVYINGIFAGSLRPNGVIGNGHHFHNTLCTNAPEPPPIDTLALVNAASVNLVEGTNAIAVQAMNSSLASSDFFIDLELQQSYGTPLAISPGTSNTTLAATVSAPPPAIRNVDHSPSMPTAGTDVVVSATVTDPDNVGTVTLTYQVVSPGSYIPRFTQPAAPTFTPALNPAYETGWITLPMNDAGTGGDAVAGDGTFSATIPASVQQHRTLVRYRIAAADALTNAVTVPYPDDEQVNFAYFCYNGVPGWNGAFRPATITTPVVGTTTIQNYSASLINSIEPFHLIALDADVINCQYNNGGSLDRPFSGTFVYRGKVYDNISFKNRGIGSTYNTGKNKWAIKFNRTRDFQAYDNWGRKFKETWNSLSLDANAYPWASVFRGAAGIEEAASYRAHELAGSPSLRTTYAHFRVIRRATEAATAGVATTESLGTNFDGQYSNDLFGLYMALEPTESNFIGERDLPEGNLYAIEGNGGDKKYQAGNQVSDNSDWNNFASGNPNGMLFTGQTEAWYRANMDLPALYNFVGLGRLFGNVDVRPGDNYRFYHRSSDNRWVILAYDLDMMFIAATHWAGTIDGVVAGASPNAITAIKRHPAIALEFRNRCRELMGLIASDPAASGGQVGQLMDEYAQMVNPAGQALTWADLDAAMWNFHPRTTGNTAATGQNNGRANFFRETFNDGGRGGLGGSAATGTWIRSIPNAGTGIGSHEGLTQWFTSYATNTYPANTRWIRKATSAGAFPGGTGADPDVNRQKAYGYKYLEWESLHGGYFNCTTNPTTGVAMGDLTAEGMTRYYAGDSLAQLSTNNQVEYPDKPVITFTGTAGYPVNDILLHSSDYRDPQSNAIAAVQFRVGEISAPGIPLYDPTVPRIYEIEELWRSAEIATAVGTSIADVRVPASMLRVGHTYRARVRHKDATGRWSFWSEPHQFVTGAPDVTAYASALRVSEINYNPCPVTPAEAAHPNWNAALWNEQEFEFIELRNVSGASVDLTDVRFTKGIDFDFSPGFSLAAGASAVLVKNPIAFAIRYPSVAITGSYGANDENSLSNGGENIKLSFGAGTGIIDFTYDDSAPWPVTPDGAGPTLVLMTPAKPGLNHGDAAEWRGSYLNKGNPGGTDGNSYAIWAAQNPGAAGPATDEDNDGYDNRLEYALMGDPAASSTLRSPTAQFSEVSGLNYATLTFTRRTDAPDVTFAVQFSDELMTWNIPGTAVSSIDNGDGSTTEVWRSNDPVSTRLRLFGRVLVTTP